MPDVRPIDANALVKTIESNHCKDCNNYNGAMCRACTWMDAMDYIEDAPTVDTHPVKLGKWKCVNDDENVWMCSNCGNEISLEVGSPAEFEWLSCPYCGAKMGGDADGNGND